MNRYGIMTTKKPGIKPKHNLQTDPYNKISSHKKHTRIGRNFIFCSFPYGQCSLYTVSSKPALHFCKSIQYFLQKFKKNKKEIPNCTKEHCLSNKVLEYKTWGGV